jgi:hypothetical protein
MLSLGEMGADNQIVMNFTQFGVCQNFINYMNMGFQGWWGFESVGVSGGVLPNKLAGQFLLLWSHYISCNTR